MFDGLFDAIARVLAFFYSLPVVGGSYGLAIILLTAAVMILLMPLTLKATKSTIKMQAIQPKLKALQKKHKDDKALLQQEMMGLYKEHGINPVGGCLPMVAQLPVFLVLFRVLRGLSRRVDESPFYGIAEHARERIGAAPIATETFNPEYLSHESAMYADLSRSTEMRFGPFDLALEAWDVLQNNFLDGLPYIVLILFVVGTSFYQQKQVSSRRGGASSGINPQQEMILKFLPLMTGVWSFAFPAGLVFYWATSNVFRIGQQGYITRAFYAEGKEGAKLAEQRLLDEKQKSDDKSEPKKKKSSPSRNSSHGSGRNGSKPSDKERRTRPSSTVSSNGSSGSGSRAEAWAKRRQERERAKGITHRTGDKLGKSSRTTPPGTQPGGSKKKRKR